MDLAWRYRLSSASNNIIEHFDQFGSSFHIYGNPIGRNSLDASLTVLTDLGCNWQFYVEASGQVWQHASSYNVLGGIKYRW